MIKPCKKCGSLERTSGKQCKPCKRSADQIRRNIAQEERRRMKYKNSAANVLLHRAWTA